MSDSALKFIDQALAAASDDQESKEILERIKRRFSVMSLVKAFERAGLDFEFEIRELTKMVRSRKSTAAAKRWALSQLVELRQRIDEHSEPTKVTEKPNKPKTARYRDSEFEQDVSEFAG